MSEYTRGRKTVYKGVTMRSRLEASFAARLDWLGQPWSYEPQCFADASGQYLPDFAMNDGDTVYYYEVKPPTADTAEALRKMHIIRSSELNTVLTVVVPTGVYPQQGWTIAGRCTPNTPCSPCLGQPFRDARMIPGTDRRTIGGRARRETVPTDPVTGRATIGGRARRETPYVTPKTAP